MPALSLRPSIFALTALLIPGLLLGCGSDSSTAAEEPQATAIVVSAVDFLNGAQCIQGTGALLSWNVTLYQTDHPAPAPGTPPPAAPPELTVQRSDTVSCEQGVAFGNVEVGGSYDAVIYGYDVEPPSDGLLPEPRYRYVCGDDPEQPAPAPGEERPPGAIAEYQALRHVAHCVQTLAAPEGETKVVVDRPCGDGADALERFQVWSNGQPFGEGEAGCDEQLEQEAADGEVFDLQLLTYRAGEEAPAYGAVCHARALGGASVEAVCDPLTSDGSVELSIPDALAALGAGCADGLLDLFVTLDTGEMLDVPDPCKGTVRFSSVAPGTRELSLSAVRGDEMLSAACSAEVQPGLSSTADCSAE